MEFLLKRRINKWVKTGNIRTHFLENARVTREINGWRK